MVAFKDWLEGATFYIGYDRYGFVHDVLGTGCWICVAEYCPTNDTVRNLVEDLDSGDNDAIRAASEIERRSHDLDNKIWVAKSDFPSKSCEIVQDEMKTYHNVMSNLL